MSDETITLTRKEYIQLKRAELLLECLQSGGVDNWDWYGEAYHEFIQAAKKLGLLYEGEDNE